MSTMAIGWDIHRRFSQVSVQEKTADGEIRVVERARLEQEDRPALEAWLRRWPMGTPVAMEGAFGWPWIADVLEALGLDPNLGHPPAMKVLARNEAKCDRRDSDRAARFWLQGIFPECYLAPVDVRQIRERLRRLHDRLTYARRDFKHQAKVAVARELCELVYVLWKKGKPYHKPSPPRPGARVGARRAAAAAR